MSQRVISVSYKAIALAAAMTTLHQRLKVLNLDHLSYSSNVTFTILKVI